MKIPTDRLREIATKAWALNDQVDPPNWTECEPIATELLACREERDRLKAVLLSKHGGEPLALLSELDEARAEREAARAEAEKLRASHGVERRLAESAEARVALLEAELAAVKRQRDELREWCKRWRWQIIVEKIDALAAEQPKPQQPEVQP